MKRISLITLSVLLLFGLLAPHIFLQKADAAVVPKSIYLTFDDGPTDSTTPVILDILKEEKVPATFFVVGRQIPSRAEILKRTVSEGHALGVHTQTHEYGKIYASASALEKDILACKKEIEKVLPDYPVRLYRFPGGASHIAEKLKSVPAKCGLKYYDWNAATGDAYDTKASAEKLVKAAIETGADRSRIILLMHDGVRYNHTVKALPQIIRYYKERGYVFLTLS